MYGFGVFLFLLSLEITSAHKRYVSKLCCVFLSYIFFVFSFTYGNALYVQKIYTDFRITETIHDLNILNVLKDDKDVFAQVIGSIGQSPVLKNMPKDYRMLDRLIPNTFGNSYDSWAIYGFDNYYNLKNVVLTDEDLVKRDMPIILDNIYHRIRVDHPYILIELKE